MVVPVLVCTTPGRPAPAAVRPELSKDFDAELFFSFCVPAGPAFSRFGGALSGVIRPVDVRVHNDARCGVISAVEPRYTSGPFHEYDSQQQL